MLLLGGLVVCGGSFFYVATNRALKNYVDRNTPILEKELSAQLGHPLKIGPYKGLRSWGIAIGPTSLRRGSHDNSNISFSSLKIQLAPLASLNSRRPVAILTPSQAKINLRSKKNKSYWVFGEEDLTNIPNFDLKIRFEDPARVSIGSKEAELAIKGDFHLDFKNKHISTNSRFDFGDNGLLVFDGSGHFSDLNFQAKTRAKNLKLGVLQDVFLKRRKHIAKGILNGGIYFAAQNGSLNCNGRLTLKDLNLYNDLNGYNFTSKSTSIGCRNDVINLSSSEWDYGPLEGSIKATLPLKKLPNYQINIDTLASLKKIDQSVLKVNANIPLLLSKNSLDIGQMIAKISLDSFKLSNFEPSLGIPLDGKLSLDGTVSGRFNSLSSDIAIVVDNPQLGVVRMNEKWIGKLTGIIDKNTLITLDTDGAPIPGRLSVQFNSFFTLNRLSLTRRAGENYGPLILKKNEDEYVWNAKDFRLDRIEVSTPLKKNFQRVYGALNGQGSIKFDPLFVEGEIVYNALRGIGFRELAIAGKYSEKNYSLTGSFLPDIGQGTIDIISDGRIGEKIWAKASASNLSPAWLVENAIKLSSIDVEHALATGSAKDLKGLVIASPSWALDSQLIKWVNARISEDKAKKLKAKNTIINPQILDGNLNAFVEVQGENLKNLNLDIKSSGKIWIRGEDLNVTEIKPFTATFSGPLNEDLGEFSLVNIPFSLLSLFIQTPASLTGMFGVNGRYRIKNGSPEVTAELVLNEAQISKQPFSLEKGKVSILSSLMELDLSLKSQSSLEPVTILGTVPLNNYLPFDLRVKSRGDGLTFLSGFTDENTKWINGTADLWLFIRGTLKEPIANGYFVIKNGDLSIGDKELRNLNSEIFFDFNRLEVQQLSADIGKRGKLSSYGGIAFFEQEKKEKEPLQLNLQNVDFSANTSTFSLSTKLTLRGSLAKPIIAGETFISNGAISTKRSLTSPSNRINNNGNTQATSRQNLPEQQWKRDKPLVLFIQDDKSSYTTNALSYTLPQVFSKISFDSLKLYLGPGLRLVSQPIATFNVDGLLSLCGPLNPQGMLLRNKTLKCLVNEDWEEGQEKFKKLAVTGVVKLTNGLVNLFTTSFSLKRNEQNVAVFTPSNGLTPYVDLKMTTRVPDKVRDQNTLPSDDELALNGSGFGGIGGSRFIKVELIVAGRADRMAENFEIRSQPPLPRNQLLDLIGGNSLTMLLSGDETQVLANLFNRSFVSPVLGNISGGFSEKLQLSVYPAYVRGPDVSSEGDKGQAEYADHDSFQKAWVTEVGIDISERINFSIQATPSREDVPPQGTIKYQFNPSLGVLGSVDNDGNWQSEFQIYLRY
ncbi:hypothetical protein EV05_1495 [Prochlorococcus sp. MIT 0601]|nr:hypothetical protein EV05_1495 [Prochlorococcus sp. MIT 0601]